MKTKKDVKEKANLPLMAILLIITSFNLYSMYQGVYNRYSQFEDQMYYVVLGDLKDKHGEFNHCLPVTNENTIYQLMLGHDDWRAEQGMDKIYDVSKQRDVFLNNKFN